MRHDIHLLTGAYALDAVDDVERGAFERHLAQCDACRSEVLELRQTVAQLACADATAPSTDLRRQVMDRVARTAQLTPHTPEAPAPRARPSRAGWLIAVAAVAVLAFALGAWIAQRSPEQPVLSPSDEAGQLMAAPDSEIAQLSLAGGGHSKVIVAPSLGAGMVMADSLARPQDHKVYQLWMVDRSGGKHPMDTFLPGPEGTAEMMLHGDFRDVTAVEITVEPSGGSPHPTGARVARAPLA